MKRSGAVAVPFHRKRSRPQPVIPPRELSRRADRNRGCVRHSTGLGSTLSRKSRLMRDFGFAWSTSLEPQPPEK